MKKPSKAKLKRLIERGAVTPLPGAQGVVPVKIVPGLFESPPGRLTGPQRPNGTYEPVE